MTYQDYIDLGFTRLDVNDSVEKQNTGYGGFHLERKINERITVSVYWNELDKPQLHILRDTADTGNIHNIPITCEIVKSIFLTKIIAQ